MATADMQVSSGMRDDRYAYLVIDDCLAGERDHWASYMKSRTFPHGDESACDYIPARGLKLAYILLPVSKPVRTARRESHEYQDALVYASGEVII